ncbi:MAG: PKD domain-containing protein [Gemmata sp.]
MFRASLLALLALVGAISLTAAPPAPAAPAVVPPMQTLDLNVGDAQEVEVGGKKVAVKLLDLKETRDDLRKAVRGVEVTVEVNGKTLTLTSATYRLPVTVAGVQIDCPVTRGFRERTSTGNVWGLDKDARVRLWPEGSPLMNPGTFRYPAKQRWFASGTQMANEPVHVDGGEVPGDKPIYYHYGLDIGGAEGLVEVTAATDGEVMSSGRGVAAGAEPPVKPRYDVVYLRDARGWYYRYSHLHTIDPAMKVGAKVKMGQKVGLLGKEGGSGGWSHLHFDITAKQPSGKWGIVEGYAFLWEAYRTEYDPKLQAVARPHQLAKVGEKVTLDGSRSWAADAGKKTFEWTLTDGKTATGARAEQTYAKPGVYSEVLKFTDGAGRVDYDFAVVNVLDPNAPDKLPPSIHAAYHPTTGIKPGDTVTFLVRTFRTIEGKETWDFGDRSPKVEVRSDGNAVQLAKDGYARTAHTYEKAGHYLVSVSRTNGRGETATARLHVRVGTE